MGQSQNETSDCYWAIAIFILTFAFSPRAHAVSPVYAYDMYTSSELINPETQEIDLSMLSRLSVLSDPYQFHMSDYISVKGIAPVSTSVDHSNTLRGVARSDDDDSVARQIIQNTIQNLFDSHKAQLSGVMASAQSLNQNMKTQIGSPSNGVKVKFEPFTTKAEMGYSGELPVTPTLSYVASQNELRFEMTRKIYGNKTLAYTHLIDVDQRKDLVGIRWNF